MKTKIILIISVLALLSACKPEIDDFEPQAGFADFSKFLAIGNSITSGYSDKALFKSGQEYSFPNILAQQFKSVGGGEFKVPYMLDEFGLGERRVLGYSTDCLGVTSLGPVLMNGSVNPGTATNIFTQGPYNNMGVPGAKSFHLLFPGYGTFNPYFKRFASTPAASVLNDAMLLDHTFFSYFIGSNDVLTYALSGGEEGPDSITSNIVFNNSVNVEIDSLTKNGAKGVIVNIPDITCIPFFTTVPAMGLLLDENKATLLNQAYTAYNVGAQAAGVPQIQFHPGYNGFIIQETDAPYNLLGGLRQIKPGELILLSIPQDSLKCAGWGSQKPIPGTFILDAQEVTAINNATSSYNDYLLGTAVENDLAFCDLNKHYKSFAAGLVFDGIKFNVKFISGGLFSLDGVHPNPRGQAIIANYVIDAINSQYNSSIPKVLVSMYPGLKFP